MVNKRTIILKKNPRRKAFRYRVLHNLCKFHNNQTMTNMLNTNKMSSCSVGY